ncbi:MAG: glycoside hydrolase family 2 protein [Halobacteriaceae archaeon]
MHHQAYTLDEGELPDLDVRLTPRPSDESARTALHGTWRFAPGPDDAPPAAPDWRRHEVPNQWNTRGYEVESGRGWYRREFRVPEAWRDGRIILRFDGAYSDAVVSVNGERIGDHVGGYTPFEFDVTDAVDPGPDNVVTVGVAEGSVADDTSQASPGAGLVRNVTLFRVPDCHLADVDVRTSLGDVAEVTVETAVRNAGETAADAQWEVTLTAPDGAVAATVDERVEGVPAGETRTTTATVTLDEFVAWNPEQPRQYEVTVALDAGERERVAQSVGLREVTVDGDQLRLNGESVTLRGVNWREADADRGISVAAAATRRDAERLREANVNYVRTGHHPPSEAFVEACDELGIVIEMEAPIAFMRFENSHRADDPSFREPLCRQALEIVARDKNHPSVCVWSIANESDWGSNLEAIARVVKRADPTRPVTFNWGMYRDDAAGVVDVANHHYPALRDSQVSLDDFVDFDRPVLFDEFAHTYCYDGRELATDPGLRDDYVRVLEACWDAVTDLDAFTGAAIWAGLDHHTPEYRWGVVDRHGRKRPEHWHVKKVYAPVTLVDATWTADGVTVELANGSTFADLADRRVEWTTDGERGTVAMAAAPGESDRATLPVPDAETVTLRVLHPAGFAINEFAIRRDENDGAEADVEPSPAMRESDTEVAVETDAGTLTVDRNGGHVTLRTPDGTTVADGLPALVATPPQSDISVPPEYGRPMSGRLSPWRCESVSVRDDGAVEIEGGYYYDTIDAASGSFVVRPRADGFEVAYDFTVHEERSAREVGLVLPLSPSLDRLSWDRDARWSTYPDDHIGRREGTARAFGARDAVDGDADTLDRTRPWAASATSRGTNDFRSTKRNVRTAAVTDDDGRGVVVHGNGDQHVRCAAGDDATDLFVLDRSLAGVGLELLDRYELLNEDPTVEEGERLVGSVSLALRAE